jgi:PAS domain S-box-containing protein
MIVKTRFVEPYNRLAHVSKIYDAVIDPMLLVDRNGTIKTANLAAGRVLGVAPELLIGKSSHLLFHNTEAEPDDCMVCRSLKQGQSLDRHEISRKHGASLLQVSVNRVEEADDAELYVEVLHDLNELAHMRQDLAHATGVVAQQRAALEALSTLQDRKFDMAEWIQSLPKVFRAPSLIRVYWLSSSIEIGMPPPARADALSCRVGETESQGKLIVYYPEAPDNVAVGFDTTERALFEMLSSALRAKLNP